MVPRLAHGPKIMHSEICSVEDLIAPLVVLDISVRAASDPESVVTTEDIARWEREH